MPPTDTAERVRLLAEQVALREAIVYQRAEKSLRVFVKAAWSVLEPGRPLIWNWHLDAICDLLEAVDDGRIKRAVINVPPRSSKSTIVSVAFPCWTWLRSPEKRFLTGSHAASLATRDAVKSRRLMDSPWWQRAWGDRFKLQGDQNQKTRYENDKTGHRIAFGVTSGITGEGGDCVIVDDGNNKDAMWSVAHREAVNEAFDQGISTRLNDPDKSSIIIVMQRFAMTDLVGHVLEQGGWSHLRLPMTMEGTPSEVPEIGFKDHRKPGDLLWPERFSQEWLTLQTPRLGSFGVASQLQQNPIPTGGGMVNIDWFRRYNTLPSRDQWVEVSQFWDTAQKANEITNDPWVCGTWVRTNTASYLVRVTRRWMNYPEGKRTVVSEHAWACEHLAPPNEVVIEAKSTGMSLLQELRQETAMPLIEFEPEQDKTVRMGVESPAIEAGTVYLPESASWLSDFEREVGSFPGSDTKDQVDVLSMSLKRFREGGANAGPRVRRL